MLFFAFLPLRRKKLKAVIVHGIKCQSCDLAIKLIRLSVNVIIHSVMPFAYLKTQMHTLIRILVPGVIKLFSCSVPTSKYNSTAHNS